MTNSTQPGRLWASVHILVSVALLGELIQTFDELRMKRAKTMARIRMLTTRLTEPMLDHLLEHATVLRPRVVRDGLGLTELEFVLVRTARLDRPTQRTRLPPRACPHACTPTLKPIPGNDAPAAQLRALPPVPSPCRLARVLTATLFCGHSSRAHGTQAMMLELGVVELGNVQPFIKQFRLLDADGNARLGRADLDATKDKSLAELQRGSLRRMKRQMSMRVGDRMGLALTVAEGSSEGGQGTSGDMTV